MLECQIEHPTSTVRRICSSSNSSEDSSEDCFGEEGRVPLLHGATPPMHNCIKIDLTEADALIKTATNVHDKYPKEYAKTAVAVGMLMTAAICNDLVLSFIHEKVPQQPPLPDVAFQHTPYIPWALVLSEYLMLSSFAIMSVVTLMHRHRWIILRRIAFIGSLLYFGRCVTMFVTQVPVADPNYYCAPHLTGADLNFWNIILRAFRTVSGIGLKINGKHTLCGDYIYSGHTVVLVTSCLFIREYSPRRWKPLHFFSLMVSMAGVVLLLISRGHYSIDVIISYWISTRVFWTYHTLAAYPSLKDSGSHHNHLSKLYWFPLFKYMECNIHKPIPRKFDWPFPIMQWRSLAALQPCKSNTL
uniref:Phosphatidylcholine:ceramide cholinephosphotransferase 1 n=1 Tax=Ascaris suum TaxID=6253 RepID=F1LAD0_ASCSU